MSIDPNVQAPVTEPLPKAVSAIENEIPAYRAISPQAVVAVILGVLSVLSFASWYFLILAVGAVALGFLADRAISRAPDRLAGRGLAQVGIVLGLLFGLTTVTIGTVQDFLRAREAKAFAQVYEEVLKTGSFEQVVWYEQPPEVRKAHTPEESFADLTKGQSNAAMFEQKHAPVREFKKALGESGGDVHFSGLEKHDDDGMSLVATALFEVHTPKAEKAEDKERFALAYMKAEKGKNGKYEWWIENFLFPYKPATFVVPSKPVDDGHGHGGGGH